MNLIEMLIMSLLGSFVLKSSANELLATEERIDDSTTETLCGSFLGSSLKSSTSLLAFLISSRS